MPTTHAIGCLRARKLMQWRLNYVRFAICCGWPDATPPFAVILELPVAAELIAAGAPDVRDRRRAEGRAYEPPAASHKSRAGSCPGARGYLAGGHRHRRVG